ncbi:hypothetical protein BFL36_12715 [Clavibacter michiganensis]|uniref:Integral membrane protein n=2 Tax=Clavibacter michiganensis TaxID=28447 RepID=A0A251Y3P8_9MICO|nr:hypothetical protein BFL36_12715 [Clavibacter michiganensis]
MRRAALSALVCTLVTATAHAAAGGGIPHPLVLGLALVAGVVLCFALGGRRVTLAHLVLAIGATQGVLHAAFAFGGSAIGTAGMAMPAGGASASAVAGSVAHGPAHAAADAARALAHSGPLAMPADHDGAMLLAHVIAGLISVCSLRAGADAVRRVARALAVRVGGAI